jgi:hypothetical protein
MTKKKENFVPQFILDNMEKWYQNILAGQPEELPIRAWWGMINPALFNNDGATTEERTKKGLSNFLKWLSTDFMPSTVYFMSYELLALIAYLPAVLLNISRKIAGVPDEVAIVVYESVEEYHRAEKNWFGMHYQNIHNWIFEIPPSSSRGFPKLFKGQLQFNQPYFMYTRKNVNWQGGITRLIVLVPKDGQTEEQFRRAVEALAKGMQLGFDSAGADCVVLRASAQCATLWRHFAEGIEPDDTDIESLLNETSVVKTKDSEKVAVPPKEEFGLADRSWFALQTGDEFPNFQFETGRPEQSDDGLISM